MRATTYCYPWDIARLGVQTTLSQIQDDGFDAIDLAATYHPIDSLSPREGFRLFSDARGAVYFPARQERYGRIKPKVHSAELAAAWLQSAEHAAKIGLGLNAWTITLFQPWIRDVHEDCARVLPSGDASGSGVCAANPDVRDYVTTLCADISDQFGIDLVRLEGIMPHTFDLDWLRPRSLVTISPTVRTLSSLCFCSACTARAAAGGLDLERIRRTVNETIAAEIAGQPGGEDRALALAADAELTAFAENHVRASIGLVRDVADRIGGSGRVAVNAITPYRSLLGDEREDVLLRGFIDAASQTGLNVLDLAGNKRVAALNAGMDHPREMSALYVTIRNPTVTSAAMLAQTGADKIVQNLQAAVDLGVTEFSLYSYGILPDADVQAFIAAVRQLQPVQA